jgi:hypothetical protein
MSSHDERPALETPAVYLTDGVFLFRVAGEADGIVELEDCYRLDLVRVPVTAVRARGLRVVMPALAS